MTGKAVTLRVVPVTREQANAFVRRLHRHSRPVVGDKCAIGAQLAGAGELVGVAIVGAPGGDPA